MKKRNPQSGEVLTIAAAGAALYYFWPHISQMFSPAAAPPPPAMVDHGNTIYDPVAIAALEKQLSAQGPAGSVTRIEASAPLTLPTLTLAGTGRRRQLGATASAEQRKAHGIAQAALNQMLTEYAPELTNSAPIGPQTPGAEMLPNGCWRYANLVNCPAGIAPPQPRNVANGECLPGFMMDAAGNCTNSADQVNIANLNSTPWTGSAPPVVRIEPAVMGRYASTVGINPGSVLAHLIGLPDNPSYGTIEQGTDGYAYQTVDGVYIRQGTATQASRPTGPIGPRLAPLPAGRLKGLGWLANALPITIQVLTEASHDPQIAAMVGTDPRAMLTTAQWNYYYTQASGTLQSAPPYPEIEPNALISALEYQAWRRAAGLGVELTAANKLGLIRNSAPGAFPLGSIREGPDRRPFIQPGNTNLYRVPGRGTVRLGLIQSGGGDHRWSRSPFPRATDWRMAE